VGYQFGIQNLGASASATRLYRAYPGAALTTVQRGFRPLFRGWVVGMELNANAAKTAGTAEFEAYVDGAASDATLIWSTGSSWAIGSFAPGQREFAAHAELDVRVTTDSAFQPTTADLELILYVAQAASEAVPA
jgi:hypothetical protein